MSNTEDLNGSGKQNSADVEVPAERLSTESGNHSNATPSQEVSITYASSIFQDFFFFFFCLTLS